MFRTLIINEVSAISLRFFNWLKNNFEITIVCNVHYPQRFNTCAAFVADVVIGCSRLTDNAWKRWNTQMLSICWRRLALKWFWRLFPGLAPSCKVRSIWILVENGPLFEKNIFVTNQYVYIELLIFRFKTHF